MSWIEVETKIKIKNPKEARKRIKKIAKFVRIENKRDEYYSLEKKGYPKKSLRVRNKGKIREVNFKQWISYKDGIHAKRESEFNVSDLKDFFGLIKDFGFKKWLTKSKKTELYITKDGINIELNKVKKLGWFIEVEILCKESEIKKSRDRITKIMNNLRYKREETEKKGYTKMLWKNK